MKANMGKNLRVEDQYVYADIKESNSDLGFQLTVYEHGSNNNFSKQVVVVLKKDDKISTVTTWGGDWKEATDSYWHNAEILYYWEENY